MKLHLGSQNQKRKRQNRLGISIFREGEKFIEFSFFPRFGRPLTVPHVPPSLKVLK